VRGLEPRTGCRRLTVALTNTSRPVIAIVRKKLRLTRGLCIILQILSLTLFECDFGPLFCLRHLQAPIPKTQTRSRAHGGRVPVSVVFGIVKLAGFQTERLCA